MTMQVVILPSLRCRPVAFQPVPFPRIRAPWAPHRLRDLSQRLRPPDSFLPLCPGRELVEHQATQLVIRARRAVLRAPSHRVKSNRVTAILPKQRMLSASRALLRRATICQERLAANRHKRAIAKFLRNC